MTEIFKAWAKELVDSLFDAKSFRDDITRDQLQGVEDYAAYMLTAAWDGAKKCESIIARMDKVVSAHDTKSDQQ